MTLEMTTRAQQDKRLVLAMAIGFLGLFAGLCTMLALAVTVVEAWQEHAEAGWPEVTARVDRCYLHQTSTGRRDRYYIDCSLSYTVGDEQVVASIYSRNVPSPQVWQYPLNQIAPFKAWVDRHPQGTPIALRYDPAKHDKIVLVATDIPFGQPHRSNNLTLLGVAAAISVALLWIARMAWPRSTAAEVS